MIESPYATSPIDAAVDRLLALEESRAANPGDVWGLSTGFPSWNKITGGLHDGEVTVLGARTSHGKTALMLQTSVAVADVLRDQGDERGQIIVISPEMTLDQLLKRYVSSQTGIPARKMLRGRLTDDERQAWRLKLEAIRQYAPFLAVTCDRLDVYALKDLVEEKRREAPIRLLVVDYLGLIYGKGHNAYERATDASQRIKQIALDRDIPVLLGCQVSRPQKHYFKNDVKDDANERPTMHDLRDSGDIEQSADNVLMLFNPDADDEKVYRWRTCSVYVDKQRDGPKGRFGLGYYPAYTRFEDINEVVIDGERNDD